MIRAAFVFAVSGVAFASPYVSGYKPSATGVALKYPASETWMIDGVAVNANAAAEVAASVLNRGFKPVSTGTVDLPVSIKGTIPRAALVGRAALTLFNVAGIGLTAYSIYDYLSSSGLDASGSIPGPVVTNGCNINPTGSCSTSKFLSVCAWASMDAHIASCNSVTFSSRRSVTLSGNNSREELLDANGNVVASASYQYPATGSATIDHPTLSEYESFVEAKTTDNAALYNAVKNDDGKHPSISAFPGAILPFASETVTAHPAQTPRETVNSATYPMADGTTSTATTSEMYGYFPTLTGIDADTGEIISASASVQYNPDTDSYDLQPVTLDNIEPGTGQLEYTEITNTQTTTTNNTTGQSTTATTQTTTSTGTGTGGGSGSVSFPDYCATHPGRLGCYPVGSFTAPSSVSVQEKPLGANFTAPTSVVGSCPADATKTLTSGQVVSMSYQPVCDFASGVRPAVLAVAFLGAAYIVSGSLRSEV